MIGPSKSHVIYVPSRLPRIVGPGAGDVNTGIEVVDEHIIVDPSPWLTAAVRANVYPASSLYNQIPVVAGFMAEGKYYQQSAGIAGIGILFHANAYGYMVRDPVELRFRTAGAYANEFPYGGADGSGFLPDGVTPAKPKRTRADTTVGFIDANVWSGDSYDGGGVARISMKSMQPAGSSAEIALNRFYMHAPDTAYSLHDVPPYGTYENNGSGGYRHVTTLIDAPAGSKVFPDKVTTTTVELTANAASLVAGGQVDWTAADFNAAIAADDGSYITAASGTTDKLLVTFPATVIPAGMLITRVAFTVNGQQTGAQASMLRGIPYRNGAEITGISEAVASFDNGVDATKTLESPQDNVFQTNWQPANFAVAGQFGILIYCANGATDYKIDQVKMQITHSPYQLGQFGHAGVISFHVNDFNRAGNPIERMRLSAFGGGSLNLATSPVDWYFGKFNVGADDGTGLLGIGVTGAAVRVQDGAKIFLDVGHQETVPKTYLWSPASNIAALNGPTSKLTVDQTVAAAGAFASTPTDAIVASWTSGAVRIGLFGVTPVAHSTGWTVTNPVTRKTFDPATVTLPQLGEVVGTLVDYLKTLGPLGA